MYSSLHCSFIHNIQKQYPENNFKNHETCEETGKCGHIEQKIQSIESDQQMTEQLELAEKDLKITIINT